jgi:hypothetical protein
MCRRTHASDWPPNHARFSIEKTGDLSHGVSPLLNNCWAQAVRTRQSALRRSFSTGPPFGKSPGGGAKLEALRAEKVRDIADKTIDAAVDEAVNRVRRGVRDCASSKVRAFLRRS